ncbi:UPF0014 family [Russula aff. rugulosa BPL654]|nr:UPF0014 family [Russula aff. rugulosa BPL654]
MSPPTLVSHPNWSQVTIAFLLVIVIWVILVVLRLGVGASLVVSALRCGAQLIVLTLVLRWILNVESMWAVASLALLLNALYGFEIVVNAERRCQWMITVVFTTMLVSTIPVSIIGAYFAMGIDPFRSPERYLPLMSLLCENAISGISVSLGYVLSELDVNTDLTSRIATRSELPGTLQNKDRHFLVNEGLRLGLMPTINRMSLMGFTTIPSMMIRTILGGTDVDKAMRLQLTITFMIAASNGLSCIIATHFVLWICVDSEQHIRRNCIDLVITLSAAPSTAPFWSLLTSSGIYGTSP